MFKRKAIAALIVAVLVAIQMPMVAWANVAPIDITGETVNETGDITATDEGVDAICADNGNVTLIGNASSERRYGIYATNSSNVNVSGNVSSGALIAVDASNNSTVEIGGDVYNLDGRTVGAFYGATVNIGGNVIGLIGIDANGSGTKVIVGGKTSASKYSAISVKEATVYANDVEAEDTGICILAPSSKETSTVVCTGTVFGGEIGIELQNSSVDDYIVTVYEVKTSAGGQLFNYDSLAAQVNYIVKDSDNSATYKNMTLGGCETVTTPDGKTYFTSKRGTITVTVADGYKLNGTTNITGSGNTYMVEIPDGGGVTLEALLDEVQKAEKDAEKAAEQPTSSLRAYSTWTATPMKTGSAASPILNGSWNSTNGTFRYVAEGAPLRNALAVISYIPAGQTQPVVGTYYFDKYGNMATGWKLINGVWYYFNEAAGETQGALLTNTTTPDGYKVGADGAWIQ